MPQDGQLSRRCVMAATIVVIFFAVLFIYIRSKSDREQGHNPAIPCPMQLRDPFYNPDSQRYLETIYKRSTPYRSIPGAWFDTKESNQRKALNTALKDEMESRMALDRKPEEIKQAEQLRDLNHAYEVKNVGLKTKIVEYADGLGIDPAHAVSLRVQKFSNKQERIHRRKDAANRIRMATYARELPDYIAIRGIQSQIDELEREIIRIREGDDHPTVKRKLIADRENILAQYRSDRDGRGERLFSFNKWTNVRRIREASDIRGDSERELAAN